MPNLPKLQIRLTQDKFAMKVVLAQASVHRPNLGGANKANRVLLERLARRGHLCTSFSLAAPGTGVSTGSSTHDTPIQRVDEGVEVIAAPTRQSLARCFKTYLECHSSDVVLVSSEDPGQQLLEVAVDSNRSPVIYLAHTAIHFPFGPAAFYPSDRGVAILERVDRIITVSRFLQEYFIRWANFSSLLLTFPAYECNSALATLDHYGAPLVTMVNPCAFKGLAVFLDVALACADLSFGAVRGWGTTSADIELMRNHHNILLLQSVENIADVFELTRLLLVPSLWIEGFPLICIEAMLNGVPVIASNSGGLPEATLGVCPVIPVTTISSFSKRSDDKGYPVPIVPRQDSSIWIREVRRVLGDRDAYASLASRARQKAVQFEQAAHIESFEAAFGISPG